MPRIECKEQCIHSDGNYCHNVDSPVLNITTGFVCVFDCASRIIEKTDSEKIKHIKKLMESVKEDGANASNLCKVMGYLSEL